ncbi:hypothetical protein EL22_27555 [Halostagnicola sp. A56]|uniref:glycosyltransferase family 4 protein n=1 Tax=Halostagnicola sp. A56 TaxID=1495067 RepID=UPI00065F6A99|nr:glycosyltransferase family 4 protein [Halostagnicola sp. A56]KMT45785.1 hypothetical protein EL22_27555 [Halostagnicola sp. A56]
MTLQQDLTENKTSKISKLRSIQSHLKATGAPVVIDSIGINLLIISKLASRYGNDVYLRPRGGFWGEFKDRYQGGTTFQDSLHVSRIRHIRDRVVGEADHIIPVSHFHKTQIKYTYPTIDKPITPIYEPYNEESIAQATSNDSLREDWGIGSESPLLLSITGFNYRSKGTGVVDFARGINTVLSEWEDSYYVVAGGGQYREEIEEKFRGQIDPDVYDRVLFPGFLSPIAPVYAAADIYLHLSFRDTLGLTVIEAQRSGLPVVVNTGGGMPEVINTSSEGNGVVRTNSELEDHLMALVADKSRQEATGEENEEWAQACFHPAKIAADFEDVLLTS